MVRSIALILFLGWGFLPLAPSVAEEEPSPVISLPRLTLDSALTVAQAALEACRREGAQVAVTVVDRAGHPQVVLRDDLAPDLTLDISDRKAYTAATFARATSDLAGRFPAPYSVPKVKRVMIAAGGVPIEAAGRLYGGVGVSGAPSGELDERCARAGVAAVADALEMLD